MVWRCIALPLAGIAVFALVTITMIRADRVDIANSLYYTYSTIAQALAAAFAFMLVFAIYRIQEANREIADIADDLGGSSNEPDAGKFEKIADRVIISEVSIDERARFVRRLYCILLATSIAIAASFLLLPLVPLLSRCSWLAGIVTAILVCAACWCLSEHIRVFRTAFDNVLTEFDQRKDGFDGRRQMFKEWNEAKEAQIKKTAETIQQLVRQQREAEQSPVSESDTEAPPRRSGDS